MIYSTGKKTYIFNHCALLTYLWIIDKCIRWALLCIFPEMSVINCQIIPTKVVKIQPIPRQIHYYMTKVLKGTNEEGKGLKGCMSEAFYKFWYCSVEDFLAFKGHYGLLYLECQQRRRKMTDQSMIGQNKRFFPEEVIQKARHEIVKIEIHKRFLLFFISSTSFINVMEKNGDHL